MPVYRKRCERVGCMAATIGGRPFMHSHASYEPLTRRELDARLRLSGASRWRLAPNDIGSLVTLDNEERLLRYMQEIAP